MKTNMTGNRYFTHVITVESEDGEGKPNKWHCHSEQECMTWLADNYAHPDEVFFVIEHNGIVIRAQAEVMCEE